MSYYSAVQTIRAVSEAVNPDGIFVHGRTWDASLNFNEADQQIFLYPFTGALDLTNHYFESWNIVMGFYFQDTQDSTVEYREQLIKNSDILTRLFLVTLDNLDGLEISGIRVEPKYRQMSGTYSGYILNFVLGTTTDLCSITVDDVIIPPAETLCEAVRACVGSTPLLVTFDTTAGQTDYTASDVPDLALAVGKEIKLVTMDGSILTTDFRSWDDTTFTISNVTVEGGEEVVIIFA